MSLPADNDFLTLWFWMV